MNINYKSSKIVKADIKAVSTLFSQSNFTAEYFPVICKDLSNINAYARNTHKHPYQVFPDYQIHHQGLGWSTGGGIIIKLPRKDLDANIQNIDVEFTALNENTQIVIEVEFKPHVSTKGLVAAHHVRIMVNTILTAIKNDIEANKHPDWAHAFA